MLNNERAVINARLQLHILGGYYRVEPLPELEPLVLKLVMHIRVLLKEKNQPNVYGVDLGGFGRLVTKRAKYTPPYKHVGKLLGMLKLHIAQVVEIWGACIEVRGRENRRILIDEKVANQKKSGKQNSEPEQFHFVVSVTETSKALCKERLRDCMEYLKNLCKFEHIQYRDHGKGAFLKYDDRGPCFC